MFSTAFVTIALLLASGAEAIKVTSPSETFVQSAGSALQLTWESVSTDPTSFAVVLVNQVSCRSEARVLPCHEEAKIRKAWEHRLVPDERNIVKERR
jgi:hypothetical protein